MADDTDTGRPGEAAAVEAAAQAEYLDCYMGRPDVPWESLDPDLKRQLRDTVRGGVAAVYPVIAAAVREQAAQDIEAMDEPDWHTGGTLGAEEMGWAWARDDAARIVRGGR